MSGKRWAFAPGVTPDGESYNFEEVHTYDPATESAVPHLVLSEWSRNRSSEHHQVLEFRPSHYLPPKPRPTLREAVMAKWPGIGCPDDFVAWVASATGIDPDKRVEG